MKRIAIFHAGPVIVLEVIFTRVYQAIVAGFRHVYSRIYGDNPLLPHSGLRRGGKTRGPTATPWIIAALWLATCARPAAAEFPPSFNIPFITNSTLKIHSRLYYLHRHFDTPHTQLSLALGGWAEWESGAWHGWSFGLTPYTSQRLAGSDENDGGGLLQAGQKGYAVLGQAYVRWSGWASQITLHRQILETPLLNSFDAKMTPVTFEAYTFENRSFTNLTLTFSQVEKIKTWTATSFQSLSDAAGFDGTDDGMTMGGLVWAPERFIVQAWEYYAHNLVNSVYAQVDVQGPDTGGPAWSLSAQGLYQQDVGSAYAGKFQAGMGGIRGGVTWNGFTLTTGGTITDKGADIYNAWASYPGYTSLMEEDCNVAGEKAWMGGVAYDFTAIGWKGLSAFINHSESWTPESRDLSDPEQVETDFTVDFKPAWWPGLSLRTRAAFVRNSLSSDGADYEDFRIVVNYERTLF
ncbi:MAG: OprD family porin [Verrucomicrobia bacterium]|nr:OprD family porin [Verrucomicrobiota bacterium]